MALGGRSLAHHHPLPMADTVSASDDVAATKEEGTPSNDDAASLELLTALEKQIADQQEAHAVELNNVSKKQAASLKNLEESKTAIKELKNKLEAQQETQAEQVTQLEKVRLHVGPYPRGDARRPFGH